MQKIAIPMEELMPLLQAQMEAGGSARLTVTGCSMRPMLHHGRDSVVLEPIGEDPKRGDLVLYLRDNGVYVLHRIIRKTEMGYICCGDNQWEKEPVERRQMLAIVQGFSRKGKEYTNDHRGYRFYVWLWVLLHPIRRPILAVRRLCGRIGRWWQRRKKKQQRS